jgi:hypothetical protein
MESEGRGGGGGGFELVCAKTLEEKRSEQLINQTILMSACSFFVACILLN